MKARLYSETSGNSLKGPFNDEKVEWPLFFCKDIGDFFFDPVQLPKKNGEFPKEQLLQGASTDIIEKKNWPASRQESQERR